MWSLDAGKDDILSLAVDDRYLYCTIVTGPLAYAYRLRMAGASPPLLFTVPSVTPGLPRRIDACDGVSVCGSNGTSQLVRAWVGGASKTFMRASGDDPNRRPFFNLAIPDGRI